jgi:NADH-quinone oxidoreductase subunit F
MDIRRVDVDPTEEERQAVDDVLGAPASAWDGGERGSQRDAHTSTVGGAFSRSQRHRLLPALQGLQSRIGWISEGGLGYVCDRLNVPPADAWAVATFYALLSTSPRAKRVLHVCDDIACKCSGADELIQQLEKKVGPPRGHSPQGNRVTVGASTWMRSPCLGMCEQAPAGFLQVAGRPQREEAFGRLSLEDALGLLSGETGSAASKRPAAGAAFAGHGALLARAGRAHPTSIDEYRKSGGFMALEKARKIGADAVIAQITESKLMGRGGAAFPTGRKWEAVARQPAEPHYIICNADESEPGTFKDRVLMEEDPFAIIEAMLIGAFATRCSLGYIYIRGEYALAATRLQNAIEACRDAGYFEKGFDIEIRRGGGAYICGEETAIFESIEGKRGEPRNKPPFPVVAGLFGKPTLVNNVETLANILRIVLDGGAAFATTGTAHSTGTRLFCLSGCVEKPGVYEAPYGVTLREVIDMAGGVRRGRSIQAVLLGGAAGTFVRPDELDLRMTHEDTREANTTLGSGVVMVFDDSIDIKGIVARIAEFFRDESCGQCVPCRVGTVRQEESLHRIATKKTLGGLATELALLEEVGLAMKDSSICGLGQTAYSAVESAIKRLGIYEATA